MPEDRERVFPDRILGPGRTHEPRALPPEGRTSKGLQRQLNRIEGGTLVEVAQAMSAGAVAQRKVRETDAVARDAIAGQVMLSKWRDTLAGNDPLLHDEIGMFADIARMAKGQIMTDLLDSFSKDTRP